MDPDDMENLAELEQEGYEAWRAERALIAEAVTPIPIDEHTRRPRHGEKVLTWDGFGWAMTTYFEDDPAEFEYWSFWLPMPAPPTDPEGGCEYDEQ